MTCVSCDHNWHYSDERGRRLCGVMCQYLVLRGLAKQVKRHDDGGGYNDVMVVRKPKFSQSKAGFNAEEIKAEDTRRRGAWTHYAAVYSEFLEYYEHFLSEVIAKAALAQYKKNADAAVPYTQNVKKLQARTPRKVSKWLADNTQTLREAVERFETLDGQLKERLGASNKTSVEGIEVWHAPLEQMRDAIQTIDNELRNRVPDFDQQRDRQLLMMQYQDFASGVLDKEYGTPYMAPWREPLKGLYEKAFPRGDTAARQRLSVALKMAYQMRALMRPFKNALDDKELAQKLDAIRARLLKSVASNDESQQAQALEDAKLEIGSLSTEYASVIKATKRDEKKAPVKNTKSTKSTKSVVEKGGITEESERVRKQARKPGAIDLTGDDDDGGGESMQVEPARSGNNNNTPRATNTNDNPAMDVEGDDMYSLAELEERTRNITMWIDDEKDPIRKTILTQMSMYYNQLSYNQSMFIDIK